MGWKILLLAGLAGAAGTMLRFVLVRTVDHWFSGFPWGTLAVNVLGAFLAGLLFRCTRAHWMAYEAYFPVIFIGFLGAFTTFSTFALETVRMAADHQTLKMLGNLLLQNGAGLAAAALGTWAGKLCG